MSGVDYKFSLCILEDNGGRGSNYQGGYFCLLELPFPQEVRVGGFVQCGLADFSLKLQLDISYGHCGIPPLVRGTFFE